MSKSAMNHENPPVASSDDDAEQDVAPPTAPIAGAPSARSDDVLQSTQECVASPAQPPPPQSWLDIAGHLGRLLSAAAHLCERMTAATSTGCQDVLRTAVMTEATGALDLPAISGAAAVLHSSAILGKSPAPQQQPPASKKLPAPARAPPLAPPVPRPLSPRGPQRSCSRGPQRAPRKAARRAPSARGPPGTPLTNTVRHHGGGTLGGGHGRSVGGRGVHRDKPRVR
ncbi:unnamed protein product [Lampetra fluviatilis]